MRNASTAVARIPIPSSLEKVTSPVQVHEFDPIEDPRWEQLVRNHPRASVFHSIKWLRALRDVYGYQAVGMSTSQPGAPLENGIPLCRISSWLTGKRLVSLPFSDHCEPLVNNCEESNSIVARLRRSVEQGNEQYVELRPVRWVSDGSAKLGMSSTFQFHALDLRPAWEQLFAAFHRDCVQRKIRRAEREKLRYEEGASESLLQSFYRLQVKTRRRQGLPPQPKAWFRGLIASFGNDLKIRVASRGDVPVASILTLSFKKSMVYKYGCSDAAYHNLGGTALLFSRAIQEAKESGFEEFEMGRSDLRNAGLIAFKEHWGAKGTTIRYWRYPAGPAVSPYVWKMNLARRIVPVVPDVGLVAIGKLLYPHIG
jgi:hypothetical protein